MRPTETPLLELAKVCYRRRNPDGTDGVIVNNVSAAFFPRSFNVIIGERNGAREPLFRVAGLLEPPHSGDVLLDGASTKDLTEQARGELRASRMGFVFANPFLLPAFTAVENVAVPLFKLAHVEADQAREQTEELLAFVGLRGREQMRGDELSVAEQHRVSLARALATKPAIILVEEMDMAFGPDTNGFVALLRAASERFGVTLIATALSGFHPALSDRVIELSGGAIRYDSALVRHPHF